MNIGICCYPTHGGSGVLATELGIALANEDHHVHIISYSVPFRLRQFHPNLFFHEVNLISYPLFKHPPYELGLINKIAEVAKSAKLDIVHSHYAIPHAFSAYVAKQMLMPNEPKIITTLHGTDITLVGTDSSYYDLVKFSIEASDGITVVSNFLKEKTIEQFKIQHPIEVIYNFVDTERFSPNSENHCQCYTPNKEKIIVHISNFRPLKRLPDVIRTFAMIQKKIPSVLLLVGEGQDRNAANDVAIQLGVQDKVHFLGNQDYVESILADACLFLLTSEKESFGLVALEAMSCGVPVVGTNVEGIPEVVEHGKTGFLHGVGDIEAMADSAIRLLENTELHQQFSRNARKVVIEKFSSKTHISHYLQYYERILSGKE